MPRKQHKYHYIYKTTCTVTGNYYIGMHSTSNLDDGYMGSGKRLGYSIRKHGLENHEREILEFLPNRDSLKQREKEIVNEQLLNDPTCMNLQLGGGGGFISNNHHKKMIEGLKNWLYEKWNDFEYRKSQSKKSSGRMKTHHDKGKIKYNTFAGKTHSEETKRKMSERASNRKPEQNSQYGTCWITNSAENKKIKKTDDLPEGWSYGRK